MKLWSRRDFVAMICVGLIVGIACIWEGRAELAEAVEACTCRIACPALTSEQLRLKVVKSYLHGLLATNIERHDAGGNYQLALLPRDMTGKDMARRIQDATLLNVLTTNAVILGSHAHIDAMNVDSLASNPSIANYTLNQREAQIIPTREIREASGAEIEAYFRRKGRDIPRFSRWERLRGFGRHFFWINQYWTISLACCDDRGGKNGLSREWLNQNSLRDIAAARPKLMAVSSRGAILIRDYAGEPSFLF